MNELAFSGQVKANFHVYRIHGDGGEEAMGVEPDFGEPSAGRALFNSPGGSDIVVACGFLDQVVDLTVSVAATGPPTSLREDRVGYDGRLWSRCEEASAELAGEIFLRNDLEAPRRIGHLSPGVYGVRLLTRALTPESQPPAQHIIRVWPIDAVQPWRTARSGYPPIGEVTWDGHS